MYFICYHITLEKYLLNLKQWSFIQLFIHVENVRDENESQNADKFLSIFSIKSIQTENKEKISLYLSCKWSQML